MKQKEESDLMRSNTNNWKGIIYFNRNDSRVVVPKMNKYLGWTLNFGNIKTYLGLIAIVAIIVLTKYFL